MRSLLKKSEVVRRPSEVQFCNGDLEQDLHTYGLSEAGDLNPPKFVKHDWLKDITDIFFAAYQKYKTAAELSIYNIGILRNIVEVVENAEIGLN